MVQQQSSRKATHISLFPAFQGALGWWLAPLPFTPEFGVRFPVSAVWKKQKMFLPHPRVKVSIVGSLRDREVACSASDRPGSNFETCVWMTVSSQSSHHPQEVLLAQFSLYVHKGGLKPDSFHLPFNNIHQLQPVSHPSAIPWIWKGVSKGTTNRRVIWNKRDLTVANNWVRLNKWHTCKGVSTGTEQRRR